MADVDTTDRSNAGVEIVAGESQDTLDSSDVFLLVLTIRKEFIHLPLSVGISCSVPAFQNTIGYAEETVVGEIEISKVRTVPFQDAWDGLDAVV